MMPLIDFGKMVFTVNILFKVEEQHGTMENMLKGNEEEILSRTLWLGWEMLNEYIKKNNYQYDEHNPTIDFEEFAEYIEHGGDGILANVSLIWDSVNKAIEKSSPDIKTENIMRFVDDCIKTTYMYVGLKVLNMSRKDLGYMTIKEVSNMVDEHRFALGDENAKEMYADMSMF